MRPCGFLEILERLGPSYNSLGEYPALLGQLLLLDYVKDCNNVRKVFLVVPLELIGILRCDASGSF